MKTPKQMLEEITGEMMDAGILLEILYKNTDNSPDTDAGISCVVRSLLNTNEKAQAYIERLSDVSAPPPNGTRAALILLMMYSTLLLPRKSLKRLRIFIVNLISPTKTVITHHAICLRLFMTTHKEFAVS
ncbi:TPA: hypothetical protein L8T44_004552 [Klebsiella pneumoniae]|nr:hypothetical protein [Klebsiella pneumoniae]HBQ8202588.1 hypothetical protein [Klebsiella pneumoniae]HCH7897445.1 hypothetical protein [Raoultella ornithinolytica]